MDSFRSIKSLDGKINLLRMNKEPSLSLFLKLNMDDTFVQFDLAGNAHVAQRNYLKLLVPTGGRIILYIIFGILCSCCKFAVLGYFR